MEEKELIQLKDTLKKHIDTDLEIHREINLALFGNKDLEIKGIVEKVNELHNLFITGGNIKKFVAWTLGIIAASITTLYYLIGIFRKK